MTNQEEGSTITKEPLHEDFLIMEKIIDYYRSEQKLYPDSKASCRLL